MEQWSFLGNKFNYIWYNRYPENYHRLGICTVNKCGKNLCTEEEERDILDFGQMSDILKEEYSDVYQGIQSEILSTTRFDENSDLSTLLCNVINGSNINNDTMWSLNSMNDAYIFSLPPHILVLSNKNIT